jgi:hypothetical protein
MEGFFMSKKGIKVGSVTLAMKGRDLLQKNGYKAYLTRNPKPESAEGCGYVIYVNNLDKRCFQILQGNGIKVLGTMDMGDAL